MDFYLRRMEPALAETAERLGRFLGTSGENLCLVDNATVGMNMVANGFPLAAGDEVLANDHEYGAVLRIWRRRCARSGAGLVVQPLPERLQSPDEIVDTLLAAATSKTRLIVVSHITSPTAVILPVGQICRRARARGIAVCIDGPHAPAAVDVALDRLDCDFYTASCHKWLSAPFGSGFVYAPPLNRRQLEPVVVSWGGSLGGRPPDWRDEYIWSGTRDLAAWLAVPAAIDFIEQVGVRAFRDHAHRLARYARQKISALTGLEPLVPDSPDWYGVMISLPLPDCVGPPIEGHLHPLQKYLWEQHQIEIPVVNWRGRRWIRTSCHLYNHAGEIDRLTEALGEWLAAARAGGT